MKLISKPFSEFIEKPRQELYDFLIKENYKLAGEKELKNCIINPPEFMKDYIKHIEHTHKDYKGKTLCGRKIVDWCFTSLDHAFYNNLSGGRLLSCKKCLNFALKILTKE